MTQLFAPCLSIVKIIGYGVKRLLLASVIFNMITKKIKKYSHFFDSNYAFLNVHTVPG